MNPQIVTCQDPALEDARQTLQKLKTRCQNAQKNLSRFQGKDLPQFHAWIDENFGERIANFKSLNAEAHALEELLELTEDLEYMTQYSTQECYRRAKYCRENPDAPNPYRDCFWRRVNGEDVPDEASPDEEGFDEEELLHDMFGDIASFFGLDPKTTEKEWAKFSSKINDEEFDDEVPFPAAKARPRPQAENGDLKKTYRQLARKLHPDHRGDADTEKSETLDTLWHQAQDAYNRGDLQALRHVEAMIETEVRGIDQNTSLEHLRHAIEGIRSQLRPVERDVRQARNSPAWMFAKNTKKRSKLAIEIDRELEADFRDLQRHLKELRRQHALLEKKSASSNQKSTLKADTRKHRRPQW